MRRAGKSKKFPCNRLFWNLERLVSGGSIRKTNVALLKKYHPEEHPEKFAEINEAYQAALLHTTIDNIKYVEIFDKYSESDYLNNPVEQVFFNLCMKRNNLYLKKAFQLNRRTK